MRQKQNGKNGSYLVQGRQEEAFSEAENVFGGQRTTSASEVSVPINKKNKMLYRKLHYDQSDLGPFNSTLTGSPVLFSAMGAFPALPKGATRIEPRTFFI